MAIIRIESDGTAYGTKVIDKQTGAVFPKVTKIVWEINSETGVAAATVHLFDVEVEIEGDADFVGASRL
jgi:hypothetical protein